MAHVVSNKEQVLNLINRYIIAAVLVCDMETNRVLFANDFAQREMGVEEGQHCCEDVYSFSARCSCHSNEQLKENPNHVLCSEWYNSKLDRWYERQIQAVPWIDGRLARLEIHFDISHLMHSDENIFHQRAYSRLILESIGDAVIVTDNSGIIRMINPQAQKLTGWSGQTGVGRPLSEVFQIINTLTREAVPSPVEKVLQSGRTIGLANHTSLISRTGREYQIADSAAPVKDQEGNIHGVILVFRDVSEDYRQQEALRRSEERFRTLVETSINAIALHEIITDEEGNPVDYRFLSVNQAFEKLTGLSREDLVGKRVLEVLPDTEPYWIERYGQVALTGEPQEFEDFSQEFNKYFLVRAYSPGRGLFVVVFDDVTERKMMEMRLREQVYRDSLTGLHNRRYLEHQVPAYARPENLPLSVIVADINGLKIINDSMGHQMGDEVIRHVAEVFQQIAREKDLAVRWGGDEFILFLPHTTAVQAQAFCQKIYNLTIAENRTGLRPTVALGYATKTSMDEDITEILRQAETSMYQHKISSEESRRSALLFSLQQALAEKSHETEEHARNLQNLAVALGRRIGLADRELVTVSLAALLHDIGKLAIPETILDKPGPLTAEEWEVMKGHSEIGYRIVASSPDLIDVAESVLYHHERWDGKGYPIGIAGCDIPITARILALVDAFDAMTTDRAYRDALSRQEAVAEIEAGAGSQFDPDLAREFLTMLNSSE